MRAGGFHFVQIRLRFLLPAALLAFLIAEPGNASPITFLLVGEIAVVEDEHHLLDGSLFPGGDVQANYVVDYSDPNGATVVFGDGTSGRRVPADGSLSGGSYRTGNGAGGNVTYSLPCVVSLECVKPANHTLVLPLGTIDGLNTIFQADLLGLPGSLFAQVPFWERLDQFGIRSFTWTFTSGNDVAQVKGAVTDLQPVPEPSTLAYLAIGLAGILMRRIRCAAR